eukprot:g4006.t1
MQERAEEKGNSEESKDVLEMSEETPRGCAEEERQEEKEARHATPPIKRMLAKRGSDSVTAAEAVQAASRALRSSNVWSLTEMTNNWRGVLKELESRWYAIEVLALLAKWWTSKSPGKSTFAKFRKFFTFAAVYSVFCLLRRRALRALATATEEPTLALDFGCAYSIAKLLLDLRFDFRMCLPPLGSFRLSMNVENVQSAQKAATPVRRRATEMPLRAGIDAPTMVISAPVGVETMIPATKELLENIEQFEANNEPQDGGKGIIGSPSSLSFVSAMSTADEADIHGIVTDEEEVQEEEEEVEAVPVLEEDKAEEANESVESAASENDENIIQRRTSRRQSCSFVYVAPKYVDSDSDIAGDSAAENSMTSRSLLLETNQ